MKKIITLIIMLSLVGSISACASEPSSPYTRYTDSIFGTFNTLITVIGYAESQSEFDMYFEQMQSRYQELHKLYDIYNNYEGINNIKTINDNAGIEPVQVDKDLLDLIIISKEWALNTSGRMNIAMGPVLKIWHDYRMEGSDDPENAKLPPVEELELAAQYTDISKVIIDIENSTVFLSDPNMRLDIGAVAKGHATELVATEAQKAGFESGAISSGGHVRTIGKPLDGIRGFWGIGIFDPASTFFSDDRNLDVVYVNDNSIVSSGDYQRYYYVGGQVYHHLIDPITLMPGAHYRAVTVITPDSTYADLVSTELFLLPYQDARILADSLEDVEALWVMPNGEVRITEGMKDILLSHGASGGMQ